MSTRQLTRTLALLLWMVSACVWAVTPVATPATDSVSMSEDFSPFIGNLDGGVVPTGFIDPTLGPPVHQTSLVYALAGPQGSASNASVDPERSRPRA